MNYENKFQYPSWEKLGSLAFFVYCLSTIFMIFCSTSAIQVWPYPWNHFSVGVALILPLILVIVWKSPMWIRRKEFKKEFVFIAIIVILGLLNIVFSEDRAITLKVMPLFLISGIGVFAGSSYLLTEGRQRIFLGVCWICLLALCIYGTLEYINKKVVHLLSYNPIPASSLLILLFAGPFILFSSRSRRIRFLDILPVVFGVIVIALTGSRGAILALLGMTLLLGILLPGRKLYVIPLVALLLVGIGYKYREHLPARLNRNLITVDTSRHRFENYFFAAHIFSKKPLFGIGLHAPLSKYLQGYRVRFKTPPGQEPYPVYIHDSKTFDNIVLCGFVEMGGLFAVTYLGFVAYLFRNLFRSVREKPNDRLRVILFLIPLGGFLIHSMSFDSLMYPHLNWIFHSLLGMMVNFSET